MSALDPVILNEVKVTQKAVADLASSSSSGPTEYPWEVFTASRSWVVPDDGEYEIIAIGGGFSPVPTQEVGKPGHGGGGGGQAGISSSVGGEGGGAGGVSIKQAASLSKGQTVVVVVGAAKGNSSVVCAAAGLAMTAKGTSSVDGGTATGGDWNYTGGAGASGTYASGFGRGSFTASGGGGGLFGSKGSRGYCAGSTISSSNQTVSAATCIGGDGGHYGGGGGVALAHSAYAYETGGDGVRVVSSSSTAAQGRTGAGGWLDRIPGYKSSGTDGEGLVAIRRVK